MPIPKNKEELINSIKSNYERLRTELLSIPPELTDIKDLEGHSMGTTMSINNLISYLLGWGELVLKWNKRKDNKENVDFPETGYKWNELGKLALKFYNDYKDDGFSALLARLDQNVEEILDLINSKTNNELYGAAWYEKWTMGRMIQLNTCSPYTNARGRIRKWRKVSKAK